MKVLVTGVKGQLGYDVMNELAKRGYEGVGVDVEEMDITDSVAVEQVMTEVHPDKVVHCAAWTAVDAAEDNQEVCHKVNVDGTANIAKMCGKLDIPMVYISTDYVFDGQGTRPWEPDDPVVEPLNVYGHSKYEGEVAVEKYAPHYYIVRELFDNKLSAKKDHELFLINSSDVLYCPYRMGIWSERKEFHQDHAEPRKDS